MGKKKQQLAEKEAAEQLAIKIAQYNKADEIFLTLDAVEKKEQLRLTIVEKLTPVLSKMASGNTLTDDEYRLLTACPNIMKASGFEYVLHPVENAADRSHNLANHLSQYVKSNFSKSVSPTPEEKAVEDRAVEQCIKDIELGRLCPLPKLDNEQPGNIIELAAGHPTFAAVTKYLGSLMPTTKGGAEVYRSAEGLSKLLEKQHKLTVDSATNFAAAIGSKYPLLPALFASEDKSHIVPMLAAGNLDGPDGKLMQSYQDLLKLERDTKGIFKKYPDDFAKGANHFIAQHGDELKELQSRFIECLSKDAQTKGVSLGPQHMKERLKERISNFNIIQAQNKPEPKHVTGLTAAVTEGLNVLIEDLGRTVGLGGRRNALTSSQINQRNTTVRKPD